VLSSPAPRIYWICPRATQANNTSPTYIPISAEFPLYPSTKSTTTRNPHSPRNKNNSTKTRINILVNFHELPIIQSVLKKDAKDKSSSFSSSQLACRADAVTSDQLRWCRCDWPRPEHRSPGSSERRPSSSWQHRRFNRIWGKHCLEPWNLGIYGTRDITNLEWALKKWTSWRYSWKKWGGVKPWMMDWRDNFGDIPWEYTNHSGMIMI